MILFLCLISYRAHAVDLTRRHFLGTTAALVATKALTSPATAAPTAIPMPTVAEDLAYRTNVWGLNGRHLFAEFLDDAKKLVPEMPARLAALERDLALRFDRAPEDVWAEMDDVLMPWRYPGLGRMDGIMWNGLGWRRPARGSREFYMAMLDGLNDIHPQLRAEYGHAYHYHFFDRTELAAETREDYWSKNNTILNIAGRGLELEEAVALQREYARALVATENQMSDDLNIPRAMLYEAIDFWQNPRQDFDWEHDALRRPRRFPAPTPKFYAEYLRRVRDVLPEWADKLDEHLRHRTIDPIYRYLLPTNFERRQLAPFIADVRQNFPQLADGAQGLIAKATDAVRRKEEADRQAVIDRKLWAKMQKRYDKVMSKQPKPEVLPKPATVVTEVCVQALRAPLTARSLERGWQEHLRRVGGPVPPPVPQLVKPFEARWNDYQSERREAPVWVK